MTSEPSWELLYNAFAEIELISNDAINVGGISGLTCLTPLGHDVWQRLYGKRRCQNDRRVPHQSGQRHLTHEGANDGTLW